MRTAKLLSFIPGIRKLCSEVERLREEREGRKEELRRVRDERRTLKAELSELRKESADLRLQLHTEPSFARRALDSVMTDFGDASFLKNEVSIDLDTQDDMLWKTTTRHYFRAGFDSARLMHHFCERETVDPAGFKTVLDLPSGFGRVTRFLRAWLPEATILACDLQEDGARSCVEKFGAELIPAAVEPEEIEIDRPVDLIWCGSLVTHLDADRYRRFVVRFGEFLAPGGLLFFSNHGERAVERLTTGKTSYGLSDTDQVAVVEDLTRNGFGYRDYPKIENYGISLASREWVEQLVGSIEGLELADYLPREWANHHDVAVCRKTAY